MPEMKPLSPKCAFWSPCLLMTPTVAVGRGRWVQSSGERYRVTLSASIHCPHSPHSSPCPASQFPSLSIPTYALEDKYVFLRTLLSLLSNICAFPFFFLFSFLEWHFSCEPNTQTARISMSKGLYSNFRWGCQIKCRDTGLNLSSK